MTNDYRSRAFYIKPCGMLPFGKKLQMRKKALKLCQLLLWALLQ